MKGKRLLLYYLLAWIAYALYLYLDIFVNRRGPQPYVWSTLVVSFFQFSYCFFLLFPFTLKKRRIPLFVVGLLVAISIFIGLRAFIEEVVYVALLGQHNYSQDTTVIYYINDNWWRALQPVFLSFIIWSFLEIFNREKETEQLKREKTQAELAFLRTQINPHFLYNTLNYIYYLAYPLSDQLAAAIIRLSGLMRYMLTDSVDGMVELEKEVEYIQNYIEIYRLRFEHAFFVNFSVKGTIGRQRVASLLLIPFVENAFKHGVVDKASDPVDIRLIVSDNGLDLFVDNLIGKNQKDASSGIGLVNLKKRLELIYPGSHSLNIRAGTMTFHTHLHLKFAQK